MLQVSWVRGVGIADGVTLRRGPSELTQGGLA